MSELTLPQTKVSIPKGLDVITLGAGCYWCSEAVFQRVKGVKEILSGYAGGVIENPTYDKVLSGTTGHAEVVQLFYDVAEISLAEIFEVFWGTHDPTTLNRQGDDLGPQYRSVIYYHHPSQGELASKIKKQLNENQVFNKPIVTEISEFSNFYPADDKQQDYYNQNGGQPYCQFVIKPKLDKLKSFFSQRLK